MIELLAATWISLLLNAFLPFSTNVVRTACYRAVPNQCGSVLNECEPPTSAILNQCDSETALVVNPTRLRSQSATITLALSFRADRLLIDDWDGRVEAVRRQLLVIGTLGILAEAHQQHLLDFEAKLAGLRQTNFYLSTELIKRVRQQISKDVKKR